MMRAHWFHGGASLKRLTQIGCAVVAVCFGLGPVMASSLDQASASASDDAIVLEEVESPSALDAAPQLLDRFQDDATPQELYLYEQQKSAVEELSSSIALADPAVLDTSSTQDEMQAVVMVPEPMTFGLALLAGLLGTAAFLRRQWG